MSKVKIDVGHNDLCSETPDFTFKGVPTPERDTAASAATITIVDGARDHNGSGDVGVLIDGRLPREEDQPGANFCFNAGTEGGRLLIDLGSQVNIERVATYSWHTDTRAPQVYTLYAADGRPQALTTSPARMWIPRRPDGRWSPTWTRAPSPATSAANTA